MQNRILCPRCGELLENKYNSGEVICPYCGCEVIPGRMDKSSPDQYSDKKENTDDQRRRVNYRNTFYLINMTGCLFFGMILYLMFRPRARISEIIMKFLSIEPNLDLLRLTAESDAVRFINNYVPDILWAAALLFAVVFLLGEGWKNYLLAFGICAMTAIGTEMMQKTGLLTGTFDCWDIIAEIIAVGAALLIIIYYWYYRRSKDEKKCNKNCLSVLGADAVCSDGSSERFVRKDGNKGD